MYFRKRNTKNTKGTIVNDFREMSSASIAADQAYSANKRIDELTKIVNQLTTDLESYRRVVINLLEKGQTNDTK